MATILTVHGTFASGPESGENWWQKGSPFAQRIAERVGVEDGEFSYQPFIWDGANSETSRRKAGLALFRTMTKLEKQGEPFCLVGHSHGGSVIAAALMESAERKKSLDSLKTWLSIGTPFIETKLKKILFARLGVFGKSIYIALLTGVLSFLIMLWPWIEAHSYLLFGQSLFENVEHKLYALFLFSLAVAPIVIYHIFCRYFEARRLHLYDKKSVQFAKSNFHQRWLSLWHVNDEAVQGLGSLKTIKFDVFAKTFAVGPLGLVSAFVLPLLIFTAANSNATTERISAMLVQRDYVGRPYVEDRDETIRQGYSNKDVPRNVLTLMLLSAHIVAKPLKADEFIALDTPYANLAFVGFMSISLLSISIIVTFIVTLVALWVSILLSRAFNPLTMGQIRSVAFGSDTREEKAVDAAEQPMWLGKRFEPLPEPLASRLQASSDAAVGRVVPKFRDALRQFTAAGSNEEKSDMMSEYLTWDELIHTSYFDDEQFSKLVAFALTQADGFRATTTFKQDPEYGMLADWYGSIHRSGPSSVVETADFPLFKRQMRTD